MALVNQVKKVVRMELWEIVRFQVLMHCYLNKTIVTDQNLDCITMLALIGEMELSEFCDKAAENKIFKTNQAGRTSIHILEKKNLVTTYKIGKDKKRIKIHNDLVIQTNGNILLDYKIVRVESNIS